MNEHHQIITTVAAFRKSMLEDPLGTLPVLADALRELGALGNEAGDAICYWRDCRYGVRKPEDKWDEWYSKVMEKYGSAEYTYKTPNREPSLKLDGRVLTMFTRAESWRTITPALLADHPIFTYTMREARWEGIYQLGSEVFRNTEDLTLDFRDSLDVFTMGVVASMDRLCMPRLKRINVIVVETRATGPLKGRTGAAIMEAFKEGRVPRGVQFFWNSEPT